MQGNLLIKLSILFCFLGRSIFADDISEPKDKESENQVAIIDNENKAKTASQSNQLRNFGASISVNHIGGYDDAVDPVTLMGIGVNFNINKKLSLGLNQTFMKLYIKNKGEREFIYQDSVVSASYSPDLHIYGWKNSFGGYFTLPISEYSRRQKVVSKFGLNATLSRKFINDELVFSMSPKFIYHLNKYTTTTTGDGDNGGNPLRHYKWSFAVSGSYKIMEICSLNTKVGYSELKYQEVGKENRNSINKLDNPALKAYEFDLNLNIKVVDDLVVVVGHNHGDILDLTQDSRLYVFDRYTSQYYLSITVIL